MRARAGFAGAAGATTTTYLVPSPQLPLLKPFTEILPPSVISRSGSGNQRRQPNIFSNASSYTSACAGRGCARRT